VDKLEQQQELARRLHQQLVVHGVEVSFGRVLYSLQDADVHLEEGQII
jgi:hypothetical protein